MILFFDTETTGLPKNWKAPVTDLDNWPRLVQLAYLVYDFDGNLIHSCNETIKPNGFTIPIEASNIHGITTDIANQRGSNIEDVFELFSIHLKRAKVIVAHNMAYDEKIIGSEMIRLELENTLDSKEKICTMESSVELCKIDGPYGYKWPKLEELHRFLFNHDFEGAHDALADIQATAKCFWELVKRKDFKNNNFNIKNNYLCQNEIFNRTEIVEKDLIIRLLKTAISENKSIEISYINTKNIKSIRKLKNIDFSSNILGIDDIETYNISKYHFTGFCFVRNELRTFKLDRVLSLKILEDIDILKYQNDIIVPVINLLGVISWKLFSLTKHEDIEIFESFFRLKQYCFSNNICEWKNYFSLELNGTSRLNNWEDWELKYNSGPEFSDLERYSLHFQNEEKQSFISLKYAFQVADENDEYFAGYKIIALNNSFGVIVILHSIPPDDWDDFGVTYQTEVCFIDVSGNIFWENSEKQFKRIESKKTVSISNDKMISKFDFVVIGNQMWMTKNLNVDQFRNGDKIFEACSNEDWQKANDQGKPAWCYYDNNPENGGIYGKLYNWYAVNDPRGLAPDGCFIPSDKEWNILINFLGEYAYEDKLRAENAWGYHFNSNNESGFTALPGGGRNEDGKFYFEDFDWDENEQDMNYYQWNELGSYAYWWSSSEVSDEIVTHFIFSDLQNGLFEGKKGKGSYIRCVNNNIIK